MNDLIQRIEAIDEAVALGNITLPDDVPRSNRLSHAFIEQADKLLLLDQLDTGLDDTDKHRRATRRIFRDELPSYLINVGYASAIGPAERYLDAEPMDDTGALADQLLVLAKAAEVTPLTPEQIQRGQLMNQLAFAASMEETLQACS